MADKESGSFFGFETTKERNRQSVQVRGVCARGVPGSLPPTAARWLVQIWAHASRFTSEWTGGTRDVRKEGRKEERKTKRFIMNICDINDHISFV
jgi:hypothetical protein